MKVIDIALFLFIFNVSIGITNSMIFTYPELGALGNVTRGQPFIGGASPETYAQTASESVRGTGQSVQAEGISIEAVFSWFNIIWKGLVVIIPMVLNLIYNVLFGIISLANLFGISPIISVPLQGMIWLIYAIGFSQWLSGRGFKEYQ